jgi:hypothetical protein
MKGFFQAPGKLNLPFNDVAWVSFYHSNKNGYELP